MIIDTKYSATNPCHDFCFKYFYYLYLEQKSPIDFSVNHTPGKSLPFLYVGAFTHL